MLDKQKKKIGVKKIEVKYQSQFSIFLNRILSFAGRIINPIIALLIILIGLYVVGYIILIFIVFFLLLFIYKKVKKII